MIGDGGQELKGRKQRLGWGNSKLKNAFVSSGEPQPVSPNPGSPYQDCIWELLKSLGTTPWCWTKGEPPTAFLASPPFLLPVVKREGAERSWELVGATRCWRGAQDSYTRLYFWPSQLCFLGAVPGRILSGFSEAAKLESVGGLFLLTGNISLVIISRQPQALISPLLQPPSCSKQPRGKTGYLYSSLVPIVFMRLQVQVSLGVTPCLLQLLLLVGIPQCLLGYGSISISTSLWMWDDPYPEGLHGNSPQRAVRCQSMASS